MPRYHGRNKKPKQELPAELPATEITAPPAEFGSPETESVIFTPDSSTPEEITSPTVQNSWADDTLLAQIQAGISHLSLAQEKEKAPKAKRKRNKKKPAVAREQVIQLFNEYFGTQNLANWQRLCIDLGLGNENLSTVTKCKKVFFFLNPTRCHTHTSILTETQALEPINVNIYDFLLAIEDRNALPAEEQTVPLNVHKFDSVGALASYSENHNKIFSRLAAKKGGPLRALLRDFYGPARGGGYRGWKKKKVKGCELTDGGVRV